MRSRLAVILMTILVATSCAPLSRTSPFSENTVTQANRLNDSAILDLEQRDPTPQDIVMLAMSDSHQNYDDLDAVVDIMNSFTADLVGNMGDFTNQGYNFEYDMYIDRVANLKFPYVTVFGNHDTNVRGKALYNRLFGDFNRRFQYRGYRFLIFNNNNLDFYHDGKVDWAWLERNVQSSTLPIVLMMHVNPENEGYFTPSEQARFWSIIQGSQVRLILHGHQHVFETVVDHGVLRHQIARVEGRQWSRITLKTAEIVIERCKEAVCTHDTTFP